MSAGIWLPGHGQVDLGVLRVDKFVSEYDERLRFGRNVETGQYCVYVCMRGQDPLPIIGFNEIPSNDVLARELYQRDALRRGREIIDDIQNTNDRIQAEKEKAAAEASEGVAEVLEWFNRSMGKDTGVSKIRLNEVGYRGRKSR